MNARPISDVLAEQGYVRFSYSENDGFGGQPVHGGEKFRNKNTPVNYRDAMYRGKVKPTTVVSHASPPPKDSNFYLLGRKKRLRPNTGGNKPAHVNSTMRAGLPAGAIGLSMSDQDAKAIADQFLALTRVQSTGA